MATCMNAVSIQNQRTPHEPACFPAPSKELTASRRIQELLHNAPVSQCQTTALRQFSIRHSSISSCLVPTCRQHCKVLMHTAWPAPVWLPKLHSSMLVMYPLICLSACSLVLACGVCYHVSRQLCVQCNTRSRCL